MKVKAHHLLIGAIATFLSSVAISVRAERAADSRVASSARKPGQPPSHFQAPTTASQSSSARSTSPSAERALLDRYCVGCHNERSKIAGLTLDKMDLTHVADGAEVWEKVVRKLRGGMMPPQGRPRPDQANIDEFVSFLESSVDRAALANPNPGRSPLHRLNRSEYANAVRDVLGLDIDATAFLPADDEANGFDNIADVLRVSPSLLEQYLTASRTIASLAVGDPAITPVSQVYRVPPDRAQDDHIEGLPLGTRGGLLVRHQFPLDGEYELSVGLLQNIVGYVPGLEWPHELEITIDGERVFLAPVGGPDDNKLSDTNLGVAKDTLDARLKARIRVKAGPRSVGVAFIRKNAAESDEPLQPFTRDLDLQNMNGIPLIQRLQIAGPFKASGPGDTPSRRRIFVCRPTSANDEAACAAKILSRLASRAYRRPVPEHDLNTLLEFYQAGRKKGTFDAGIEQALRLVLTSPSFLFRGEPDPPGVAAGAVYPVNDLEFASRLSFFLWSSVPDDELLNVAAQRKLRNPVILERQVRRMLADPRSQALINNFAAQWLFLRNLQSFVPDQATFPNFDDNLRQAFKRETELFFESIMREDRSVIDLLDADYTFVNERLARHYGIQNIYGDQFRRVTLTDENRRGLLGQGSVLAVTSYPNRTSPVLRGKWILENILGTPPPPPPADVPPLKENGEGGKVLSGRELLEEHRKNPACATCHKVMDPLGFSLENFDAVGEWRTREAAGPVDPGGQLADGTAVDGPVALRRALLKRQEQFVRTITEKLLTYGLGRGLEYYDMPVVRAIARDTAGQNYRFSSLVMGIVRSAPFQMKKAQDAAPANTSAHR
jgi:Protein of unknown function (DUF1592)/Protein of unknown function (DUF1588)/Protein of unknown function (DUF1585)/Protein of unknown function (DUF1587)/Protein of unknown function (DUF1595)/Planctomycete cytochrome C